ncbi:hypothetical protein [Caulobacter sp. UC70_42]|uniref:hypothetical protein n=1 Tax=Caulobacter sp. UC70_42 TaxID=3374551 RepID=UPI0037581242
MPLIGAVIGAALQYAFGRSLETRKQLVVQRAQAYADFFRGFAALAQSRSSESLALVADAKTRICIYGSEKVVLALAAFERAGATTLTPEGEATIIDLMRAMRRDVAQSKAQVPADDLSRVLLGPGPGKRAAK